MSTKIAARSLPWSRARTTPVAERSLSCDGATVRVQLDATFRVP
jgi:hypothetical protein